MLRPFAQTLDFFAVSTMGSRSRRAPWTPPSAIPFPSQPTPPILDLSSLAERKTSRHVPISYSSPVPIGHSAIDRVHVSLYRSSKKTKNVLLIVPPWRAASELPFRWIIQRALSRGVDVLFYHTPHHFERRDKRYRTGLPFLCWNLERMRAAFDQSIVEIVQLMRSIPSLGYEAYKTLGLSLGGHLTALALTIEGSSRATALIAPPLRFMEIIAETPLGRSYLRQLSFPYEDIQGEVETFCETITPDLREAMVPAESIHLYLGTYDTICPQDTATPLIERWGLQNVHRLPHGHISLVFLERGFLRPLLEA